MLATRCALVVLASVLVAEIRADDPPRPEVRFLGAAEAQAVMSDESVEPYVSRFQALEIIAKTGSLSGGNFQTQRDAAANRYKAACRDFTADERTALSDVVRVLDEALAKPYPLFAQTEWHLIKLDGTVEGGRTHTRGRCVVLTDSFIRELVQARAKGGDPAKSSAGEVLVHAKCHVMQRLWPALFEKCYVDVWRFIRAKDLPTCPWLVKQQLLNPDGLDVGWVYPAKAKSGVEYWQPLAIVREGVETPRMPDDVVPMAIALDRRGASSFALRVGSDGRPAMKPLGEIAAYAKAFGAVAENHHPNETFAAMFALIAMRDVKAAPQAGADVDLTALTSWCKTHLAKPPKKTGR